MRHEIQMWKSGPKVSSVDIRLPGALGEKETVTAGTKDVDGIISRQIRQANGQYGLALAKNVWTSSKGRRSVFLVHGVHASIRHDIPK
jgi:hypothetical protein